MAMNANDVGKAIAAYISAKALVSVPGTTISPTMTANMEEFWTNIVLLHNTDILNATVVTNPGQSVQVTPASGSGATNAPGTANIMA